MSAAPQAGTDYIYTTAYYAQGTQWLPTTLLGDNAAPSYSTGPASGSLNAAILSTLPLGTNYIVLWDWLWDATARCYKGPGLNQCNTGTWRLQTFSLTAGGMFTIGDRVQVISYQSSVVVNVRSTPSTSATILGPQPVGALGTVIGGPVSADGYTWWQINYDTGADGWSVESYLQKAGAPTPTPTPTPSTSPVGCASGCNNYYVSPTGSDSNPGTQASPWKTFQHANSAAALGTNGTVVHFASGSYSAGVTLTQSGTLASRRFIWQSDVQYGAHLDGTIILNSNYSDLRDFDLTNTSGGDGVVVGFSHTTAGLGNFNRIVSNYVHDIAFNPNPTLAQRGAGCPSGALIEVRGPSHDNLIDSNRFNNTGYWGGCTTDGGSSNHAIYIGGYHNAITNNIVSNAAGYGISMHHNICQNVVANNTVFHNFNGGINFGSVSDGLSPCTASDDDFNSINNNLVVRNGFGQGCSVAPWNATGCISHGANSMLFYNTGGNASHNKAFNNYLAGNFGSGACSGAGNSPSGGAANSLQCASPNSPTIPPAMGANQGSTTYTGIFVNYQDDGSGDYHLAAGSPAIGAGTLTSPTVCAASPGISPCVPTTDFSGKTRPNPPSIGAYEQ